MYAIKEKHDDLFIQINSDKTAWLLGHGNLLKMTTKAEARHQFNVLGLSNEQFRIVKIEGK